MTATLLITIFTESIVVVGYSLWCRKPVFPILLTSICINILTQSLLWIGLNFFFRHYLITLAVAEILIWGMEALLLNAISANRLRLREAAFLSLSMNLFSFGLGWFLPI